MPTNRTPIVTTTNRGVLEQAPVLFDTDTVIVSGKPPAIKAIIGTDAPEQLKGTDENDLIIGNGGDDWLNGGKGADRMYGGQGDDHFIVDNVGDVVVEKPGEGRDAVYSSIDYKLGDGLEDLYLTGKDAINGW